MNRRFVIIALVVVTLLIAGFTAARMITVANILNAAAAYAATRVDDLSIPRPLPASTPYDEPPFKVEAVARYGDAVEVQITRRYQTLRHAETQFTVTYFYQPTAGSWQLVPAPESFWGEQQATTAGVRLIVRHPERDTRLVQNLINVADPALQSACERWGCSLNVTVVMQFLPYPDVEGDLAYPSPRFTGVPMTLEANDDYLSSLAAEAILALAKQLGQLPEAAQAEINRLNLYTP